MLLLVVAISCKKEFTPLYVGTTPVETLLTTNTETPGTDCQVSVQTHGGKKTKQTQNNCNASTHFPFVSFCSRYQTFLCCHLLRRNIATRLSGGVSMMECNKDGLEQRCRENARMSVRMSFFCFFFAHAHFDKEPWYDNLSNRP